VRQPMQTLKFFDGILHALEFPCHKDRTGWFDAITKKRLDIQPTHWRRWT
jgi:hypothetical protein